MYKNVLAATDLLTVCDPSVLVAAEIAKRHDARLYILHVLESPYSGPTRNFVKHFKTGEEIVSDVKYEGAVKEELGRTCAEALKPHENYEIKVALGLPWEETLRWARARKADLIVLGSHSNRATEKGVARLSGTIGSTVEGVIMRERCPVVIVSRPVPEAKLEFKNVMVCVDFSKSCESAMQFAIKVAQKHGSKILAFHMAAVKPSRRFPQAELEEDVGNQDKRLEEFSKRIPEGIEYEYGVWEGTSPHVEILKYAREKGVNLIAMGSHTKEKGDKLYVGSAVVQVSSTSVCPVAVITDSKALLRTEG